MNTTSQLTGLLYSALDHPTRGVVGVVDDLLRLCPEQGLQLDWQTDRCRVRSLAGGAGEVIDRPLRKSVFRAILARLAALCNDRSPNSVSPFGGEGTLSGGTSPATLFRVSFANTPDDPWFVLRPARIGCAASSTAPTLPGLGENALTALDKLFAQHEKNLREIVNDLQATIEGLEQQNAELKANLMSSDSVLQRYYLDGPKEDEI